MHWWLVWVLTQWPDEQVCPCDHMEMVGIFLSSPVGPDAISAGIEAWQMLVWSH